MIGVSSKVKHKASTEQNDFFCIAVLWIDCAPPAPNNKAVHAMSKLGAIKLLCNEPDKRHYHIITVARPGGAERARNWRKASRATLFLAANRRHIFTILRWCHINLQHEVSSLLASSRPPTHTMIIAHCAVRSRRSANYLMRAPRAALCLSNSNNTRERSMCRCSWNRGKKWRRIEIAGDRRKARRCFRICQSPNHFPMVRSQHRFILKPGKWNYREMSSEKSARRYL